FTVEGIGDTDRLRIATLDDYDGETFQVGTQARFFRQPQSQDQSVTVAIGEGYRGVWVPVATVEGGAPTFAGPRAELLADAYYANQDANAGVVIIADEPAGIGLRPGDSYAIAAAHSSGPELLSGAQGGDPRISPEEY